MSSSKKVKKLLWLAEQKDLELELVGALSNRLDNVMIDVLSIKYWLFLANLSKYDLVVIPFLPSRPSAHCSLIEGAMLNNVPVVVLNWWQSFSTSEIEYRESSLQYFAKYPLYVCSWLQGYTQYLKTLGYKHRAIECEFHAGVILKQKTTKMCLSNSKKTIFLPVDFGLAFISDTLKNYRLTTGYKKNLLYEQVESDQHFVSHFIRDILDLSIHNPDARIIVAAYPSAQFVNFYEELKAAIGNFPNNIHFDLQGNTAQNLLASNVLITNVPDLATSKASTGGFSILYKPTKGSRYFDEPAFDSMSVVTNLRYSIEEIVNTLTPCSSPEIMKYSDHKALHEIIDMILDDTNGISLVGDAVSTSRSSRIRITLYNLKQHFLRIYRRCCQSSDHHEEDHFMPFRVKSTR